jgi:hypothetical protein
MTALANIVVNGTLITDGRGPLGGPGVGSGVPSRLSSLKGNTMNSATGGSYGGSGGTNANCRNIPFISTEQQVSFLRTRFRFLILVLF